MLSHPAARVRSTLHSAVARCTLMPMSPPFLPGCAAPAWCARTRLACAWPAARAGIGCSKTTRGVSKTWGSLLAYPVWIGLADA